MCLQASGLLHLQFLLPGTLCCLLFPGFGPFHSSIGSKAVHLEKTALTTLLKIAYPPTPTFQIFYMAEPSYKIGEIAINYKDSGIIFNIFLIY